MPYKLKKNLTDNEIALCDTVAEFLTEKKNKLIVVTCKDKKEYKRLEIMIRSIAETLEEAVFICGLSDGTKMTIRRKEIPKFAFKVS